MSGIGESCRSIQGDIDSIQIDALIGSRLVLKHPRAPGFEQLLLTDAKLVEEN